MRKDTLVGIVLLFSSLLPQHFRELSLMYLSCILDCLSYKKSSDKNSLASVPSTEVYR